MSFIDFKLYFFTSYKIVSLNLLKVFIVFSFFFFFFCSTSFFFFFFKKLAKCLKRMTILDDTLKGLGFQTKYKNIRMSMILVVIGWLVTVVLLNLSELFLHLKVNEVSKIISTCLINQPIHNNTILDLIFIILLLYVFIIQYNRERKKTN